MYCGVCVALCVCEVSSVIRGNIPWRTLEKIHYWVNSNINRPDSVLFPDSFDMEGSRIWRGRVQSFFQRASDPGRSRKMRSVYAQELQAVNTGHSTLLQLLLLLLLVPVLLLLVLLRSLYY